MTADVRRTAWTGIRFAAPPAAELPWRPYRSSDRAPLIDAEDRVVDDIDRDVGTAWGDQVLSFR